MVLESNRTGRIFTILFLSFFLKQHFIFGGVFFNFFSREVCVVGRASSQIYRQKKTKTKKLVIFNAYLWRCNMALFESEIEIVKRQGPSLLI